MNIAGSILKATNDTTPLLIEVSFYHIFIEGVILTMGVFQNLDTVRSTAPLAVTFAEALFEEQREQNRKVKSNI